MNDKLRFRVNFSKIKLKTSASARKDQANDSGGGNKSKMEKKRIRRKFEKINHDD